MAISGDIRCFVQANNGDILAGVVGNARVYKSSDDGVTWSLLYTFGSIASDTVRAFAKSSDGVLYAAVTCTSPNRGLWKSTDNGVSWTQIISLTGGTTAITDDGAWDVASKGTLIVSVLKDEHNGRNIVVRQYSPNSGLYLLPAINASDYLDNRYAPHAIAFHPVWNYDTNNAYYIATTNQFSTQTFRLKSNDTITQLNPTSSAGAHNSADNGQRDLAEFVFNYQGNIRHTALLATYRSIATAGTEIWSLTDLRYPYYSIPNDYFVKISTILDTVRGLYVDPADLTNPNDYSTYPDQRTIWGAGNGNIWVSYNKGYTWTVATASPTNQLYALLRTSAGTLIAGGDSAEIFRYTGTGGPGGGEPPGGEEEEPGGEEGGGGTGTFTKNTAVLGREATPTGFVGVINKSTLANVTFVFNYDGAAYTYLQFDQNPPYTLFDATPAVGDIIYFGCRTTDSDVPNGPFASLIFNLTQVAQGISGYVWEYWNGASWGTLTVSDNTNGFSETGENSVHWRHPSNWATTTVNTIVAYWVRVRITGVEAITVPPIHDGRFIYTLNLPWVELAAAQVNGNVPALARIRWYCRSDDESGSLGLSPYRLVCGLRSMERGENFQAYLNASDIQSPFGITASVDTYGSFSSDIAAPTGRKVCYSHPNADALNAFVDHVLWTIDTTIARNFYGTYRAFVRCKKASGAATVWKLRIKVSFGSEGIPTYSKDAFITSTSEFEVLDLGRVRIPNTEIVSATDNVGDELKISVQGYCTTQSIQMCVYDLILMPTDEWAADCIIPSTDSSLANSILGGEYLDIDSITNPKNEIASYVRKSSGLVKTNYRTIANGPAILQSMKRQRVWFFFMERVAGPYWRAYPEIGGNVLINKVQRYSVMRGSG